MRECLGKHRPTFPKAILNGTCIFTTVQLQVHKMNPVRDGDTSQSTSNPVRDGETSQSTSNPVYVELNKQEQKWQFSWHKTLHRLVNETETKL